MGTTSEAFSGVVFACSNQDPYLYLPINNNMRQVLQQIDGHRSFASFAFVTGRTMMKRREVTLAIFSVS